MAQHDYNIANQSGADFRADLNNALLAIATVNSGSTEPSTTFAHQLWVDTSSSVLKIRNAADNAWITTGVSITASNTFTGNLTGNVTGNLTGNVTGNVTGDLTGNADTATILATARTISLSGDVAGSASFDGSGDITISTTAQIDSIALGTDTTGDYVQSISGGTGVTITGGTGEGSTPSVAIGQAVATTDDVTFNIITATNEFIGDLEGGIRFNAKADGALSKGDVVYISGVSGDVPTVAQAKADDASKMPAFGLALSDANDNAALQVVTFGTIEELDTSGVSEGQILYVSTTAGAYTTTAPTGESSQIQNIGKVIRSHAAAGSIKVGGAGRSNATPNLNNGKIFIGNGSNQSSTATLDTSIVVENTNLYYTTTRANTDFDTRLATKDTGDLTEGSNLYYTTARVNSDFDTRLATKSTTNLAEGSNLYYTDARVNSAFDTRLATKDTDDLTEGTTNLYYTSGRANTDFDTRLATKSTTNLAEGTNLYYTTARFDSAFTSKDTDDLSEGSTNLYYTTARFDSAFGNKTTADLTENTNLYYTDTRANSAIDARVTKAFVDALGIQASSVDANSVTLGTDTVGNYVATVTGTANKITVSGSGSESAAITLSLPDDVQIADSLTVAGNLTVNGTLTSLDTTNLDIEDNLFQLNAGLTGSPVNDSGMLINRGSSDNSIFMWDESVDKFTLGLTTADGSATGNITLNSLGTLVANLEGNVTGNVTGTVSSLSNHDTDDLAEGTNLYYTQARFDSALAAKSTSDLSEGSNLYYTDARFDTRLATKDTDDVAEGLTNLYYTSARFDSAFGGKSTSDLSEGTNLYYTSARANSDFDTRLATKSTSDLSEGSNLYYTDARAQAVSINNVVEDTTPQLGGDLDLNSSDITGTGDINITGTIQSSGNITGTLATAAQPNITSVGTLTGLNVTGTPTFDGLAVGTTSDAYSQVLINSSTTGESELRMGDTDTDAGSIAYTNSNDTMTFRAAAGARMSLNSTGIDVTGTAMMDGLTVDGTGDFNIGTENVGIDITSTDAGAYIGLNDNNATGFYLGTAAGIFYLLDTGNSPKLKIQSNGDISFYEDTGTTAKFFWDASAESLGIGTTSPSYNLHVEKSSPSTNVDLLVKNTGTDATSNTRIMSYVSGASGGDPKIGLGITGVRDYFWRIDNSDSDKLILDTNGTDILTIDTSGNLLVGKTSASIGTVGCELRNDGYILGINDGDAPLYLNRLSSDGDIAKFYKDGSAVGSIAVNGSTIQMGTSNTQLAFSDVDDAFFVKNAAGANRDGSHDLGKSNARFKDLYLSGGAYLGGTGAANKLDDYEEGTWTPNIGAGITVSGTGVATGSYTKIGRQVTLHCQISVSSGGSLTVGTSNLLVGELPFTIANSRSVSFLVLNAAFSQSEPQAAWSDNTYAVTAMSPTTALHFAFTYASDE